MPSVIFELCDGYVQRISQLDPVMASYRGVTGDLPPSTDYSPDGYAARADLARDTLRRLDKLTPESGADRLAADHLRERLGAELSWYEAGESLRPLRAPFGLLAQLRDSVDLLPRGDESRWRVILARVAAIPEMLASWRASLAAGLDQGVVAARRQAVESAVQAQRYADTASLSVLLAEYGDGASRTELAEAVCHAQTALAGSARWLRDSYAPRATEADAVGPERYAIAARMALGADIDAREAYGWAWEELRRLEEEMAAEADRVRPGATVDEAISYLDGTEFLVGVDAYQGWLQERHDEALERLHGVHFDIAEQLRQVTVVTLPNSSAGSAYYTAPSDDFSRPARTWWPVANRERFGVWAELTTVFHEGVPGHHLQLGQILLAPLSRFSRMSRVSAHSEGWALYAERLADELGWHGTPGQRLGMLKASALRAARVVIDIGLHLDLPMPAAEAARHGPRWNFEVATEVLRDRGRIAPHRLHPEVVRYCGWPAQASSYKLGERAWLAARAEARERDGAAFDLKRWHTDALALGPVGLATLAETLRGVPAAHR